MISYRTALCFIVALGLTSVAAMGQAVAPLPTAFRQQAAFSDAETKTVDAWVAAGVQRLGGQDVAQQTRAREDLVAGGNGSPAFAEVYAKSLSDALIPVIKGKDFRARLNAAIVIARVADKTNTPRLHDAAMVLIADKNDAIALWGIKTAKAVVPAMFAAQGAAAKTDLIIAVAQAAATRNSGAIVAEAYQVLAPGKPPASPGPLVKATLPPLLKLMASRNQAYVTGVPEEPTAENFAMFFMTLEPVWAVLTPADKASVMQQTSDLIGMAGQRYAAAPRLDQEHLLPLIVYAGKTLQVIAQRGDVNSAELGVAATNLGKLNGSIPAAAVQQATAAVFPILTKIAVFAQLTPAPAVKAAVVPTTAPSPAPAGTMPTPAPGGAAPATGGAAPVPGTPVVAPATR